MLDKNPGGENIMVRKLDDDGGSSVRESKETSTTNTDT